MSRFFSKLKDKIIRGITIEDETFPEEYGEDYLEIDTEQATRPKSKILIKPFVIREFEDVKPALDALRDGYTIALVNIRPIKDKDIVELKRAVNKLKKTCDAINGDIAGFGEDWIVVTPSFAQVHRNVLSKEVVKEAVKEEL
ncbi:MAG: cell division protein SepF [Nanoarchaeota archaeon]|nr:cell division protein SepF [Nanoarchaeota archaeon]